MWLLVLVSIGTCLHTGAGQYDYETNVLSPYGQDTIEDNRLDAHPADNRLDPRTSPHRYDPRTHERPYVPTTNDNHYDPRTNDNRYDPRTNESRSDPRTRDDRHAARRNESGANPRTQGRRSDPRRDDGRLHQRRNESRSDPRTHRPNPRPRDNRLNPRPGESRPNPTRPGDDRPNPRENRLQRPGNNRSNPRPSNLRLDVREDNRVSHPSAHRAQVAPSMPEHHENGNGNGDKYVCPAEFVRHGQSCYYLSRVIATWQDAHFACKDKGAHLARMEKQWEDKNMRTYLNKPELARLERWIGGIYNWESKRWVWGSTGKRLRYQGFSRRKPRADYHWHCIVMDPAMMYRWGPRSCVQPKHYICEKELRTNGATAAAHNATQDDTLRRRRAQYREVARQRSRAQHRRDKGTAVQQ